MIADMINNKRFNHIVTDLYITGRKLKVFLPHNVIKQYQKMLLRTVHIFHIKIPNK